MLGELPANRVQAYYEKCHRRYLRNFCNSYFVNVLVSIVLSRMIFSFSIPNGIGFFDCTQFDRLRHNLPVFQRILESCRKKDSIFDGSRLNMSIEEGSDSVSRWGFLGFVSSSVNRSSGVLGE